MTSPGSGFPTSIFTPRDNLDLPVDTGHLPDAIELLERLQERATSKADFVTDTCAVLLGSDWSGRTRDSFETLRTNLVTDLDECATQAETAAGILREVKELVERAQERMDEIRSPIWSMAEEGRPVHGGSGVTYDVRIREVTLADDWKHYEFVVHTEEAQQAVETAIADGVATRTEFRENLEQLVAQFDPGPCLQIQGRWREVVYDVDGQHPALPTNMANQPFILPDQAAGTWTLWTGGEKVVTTTTPVSDLQFAYDDETDMFVVEFQDKTERFLPGTEFLLHTGDGREYKVVFSDGGDYAIYDLMHSYDKYPYDSDGWQVEVGTAPPVETSADTSPVDIVPLAP